MFIENIRFQVAALLIIFIVIIVYAKNKKLPLISTRWFSVLLASVSINLVFDIATVYTITHMDVVSPGINRLFHQFFIGTLNFSTMCLYLYIDYLGHQEKRRSFLQLLARILPFMIATIVVIFGELKYRCDEGGAYSYGTMANTVYCCCAIYLVATLSTTIRHRWIISKERAVSVYAGIAVWVSAAMVQFVYKSLLTSGLALSLLVLIIFLSFENPREYLNEPTESFNGLAYQKMLAQAFGHKRNFFVIDLTIDEYATMHRMFGQDVVNRMLKEISAYIRQVFHMRVYHPSENHLVVIMDKQGISKEQIIDLVCILHTRFEDNWNFGASSYHLDANITIVECPKYAMDEKELHDVLYFMEEQKDVGTMGIRTVNQHILEQRMRKRKIADLVQEAIYEDGITMLYQPIYSVKEKAFLSAEALVRLKNTGDMGFISPEEFISIAEEKGLIMDLGACIFEEVCGFIQKNDLQKLGIQYMEVNLSAIQCMDSDLPRQLSSIMKKYEIPPSFINLEITETASIQSGELLAKNMKKLMDMGCSFSMDDFGTGYSNLCQIAEVKYDLIKLDKSLIWPCFEYKGENANVILSNVITMINRLHIKIVAEGVETLEQVERLCALEVDYLQGYYYSKPLKGEDYLEYIRSRR